MRYIFIILAILFFSQRGISQIDNSTWIWSCDNRRTNVLEISDYNTITRFSGWDSLMWETDTVQAKIKNNTIKINWEDIKLNLKLQDDSRLIMDTKGDKSCSYIDKNDSLIYKSSIIFNKISQTTNTKPIDFQGRLIGNSYNYAPRSLENKFRLDFISEDRFILFVTDEGDDLYFQIDKWDIYKTYSNLEMLLLNGVGYLSVYPLLDYDVDNLKFLSVAGVNPDTVTWTENKTSYNRDSISNQLFGSWKLITINGDTLNSELFPPLPPGFNETDSLRFLTNFKYTFNEDETYIYDHYFKQRTGDWKLSNSGDYILLNPSEKLDVDDTSRILFIESIEGDTLSLRILYSGMLIDIMSDFVTLKFKRITTPNSAS